MSEVIPSANRKMGCRLTRAATSISCSFQPRCQGYVPGASRRRPKEQEVHPSTVKRWTGSTTGNGQRSSTNSHGRLSRGQSKNSSLFDQRQRWGLEHTSNFILRSGQTIGAHDRFNLPWTVFRHSVRASTSWVKSIVKVTPSGSCSVFMFASIALRSLRTSLSSVN